MIASVRGIVLAQRGEVAVIEVGGVGLALQCTPATLARLRVGAEAALATALVVREDSLTLYGFVDEDEREVFEQLQTATGVGPRLAQAVLAVHGPDDVRRAVATEDLGALTQVPGIGRKGAQRIVIELKDRLGPPRGGGSSASTVPAPRGSTSRDQVLEALQGLGWAPRDAEEAVSAVTAAGAAPADDVAAMLRAALRTLSRS